MPARDIWSPPRGCDRRPRWVGSARARPGPAPYDTLRASAYGEAMVDHPVPRRGVDADSVAVTSSYRELIDRLQRRIRESQAMRQFAALRPEAEEVPSATTHISWTADL
jgi:hypothetical protein